VRICLGVRSDECDVIVYGNEAYVNTSTDAKKLAKLLGADEKAISPCG
jgi:hypothetical protein